jgi:hypothetical protein
MQSESPFKPIDTFKELAKEVSQELKSFNLCESGGVF